MPTAAVYGDEVGVTRRHATMGQGPNAVLPAFEAYQAARIEFAREVARLALPNDPNAAKTVSAPGGTYEVDGAEKTIQALEASYHLLDDMRPLVTDQSAAVRENALIAMGRMSDISSKLHDGISEEETIKSTVDAIKNEDGSAPPNLLKAAIFLLHAVVKASAEAAAIACEKGAPEALRDRLDDNDSSIKAAACWCIAAIANHEQSLAAQVSESCSDLLGKCLKEPSLPLRRVALACLGCVAKHDLNLATSLNSEGILPIAVTFLTHKDMLLRRQACRLLACATQHDGRCVDWVNAEARKNLVQTLRDAQGGGDGETGAFAATLVQQLAKHSSSASSQMVDAGVVPLLVDHIAAGLGSPAPSAAALGYICGHSSDAATEAVESGAISAIKPVLAHMAPAPTCAMLCQCLGSIGDAGEEHASAIATSGAMQLMAESTLLRRGPKMGPETAKVARKGIAKAVGKCTGGRAEYEVLAWMVEALPFGGPDPESIVLAALLKTIAKILGEKGKIPYKGSSMMLDFMQRGALTLAQEAKKSSNADLRDALKALNQVYPPIMVDATDPDFEKKLLAKIDPNKES